MTRSSSNSAIYEKQNKAIFDDSDDSAESSYLNLESDPKQMFANLTTIVSSDDDN